VLQTILLAAILMAFGFVLGQLGFLDSPACAAPLKALKLGACAPK
jgi:hypothetical protein